MPKSSKSYQPELPEDLILQTFIKEHHLYVASYLLNRQVESQLQKGARKKKARKKLARARQALNYSFLVGTEKDMEIRDRIYEYVLQLLPVFCSSCVSALCSFEGTKVEVLDQVIVAFSLPSLKADLKQWKTVYLALRSLAQKLQASIDIEESLYKDFHHKQVSTNVQTSSALKPVVEVTTEPVNDFLF